MSKEKSPEVKVFEVSTIKKFVKLMDDHGLTEVDLQQADQKIRLCKRDPVVAAAPVAAPVATPQPSVAAPATSAGAEDDANIVTIDSPMVGTFYSAATPDATPFIAVGDSVDAESVVCIVEAMKIFNHVDAEVSGVVKKILKNSQ